jgi:hypothetical protein
MYGLGTLSFFTMKHNLNDVHWYIIASDDEILLAPTITIGISNCQKIQIQTPELRDCTQLPVHKQLDFQARIPESRTPEARTPEARVCSQLPVHAQAPAPITSLPQ